MMRILLADSLFMIISWNLKILIMKRSKSCPPYDLWILPHKAVKIWSVKLIDEESILEVKNSHDYDTGIR